MVHFSGSNAIERVPSPIKGLANSRFVALMVAFIAVSIVSTFSVSNASASHSGSEVCDPSTGNCYEYVAGPLTWADAKAAAEAMTHNGVSGHLATMTSTPETAFVVANVPDAVYHHGTFGGGAWIGGIQTDESGLNDEGWEWVTGEPWSFTNWAGGEPNNAGPETVLQFWGSVGGWNDALDTLLKGYLVEYDAVPVLAQTLDLDARLHGSVPPAHISTTGVLEAGKDYLVTVEGNWSNWLPIADLWTGVPDPVMFPSPSVDYTGAPVNSAANDAEWWYADTVPHNRAPTQISGVVLFSVDGGLSFYDPVSLDGTFNSSHVYEYVVTGTGLPAAFRTTGSSGDDHGVMKVSIVPVSDLIYTVTQGANSWDVTTVTTDPNLNAAQYYSYGSPWASSSNLGTETDGESQLFLYLDQTVSPAAVSLFITHDKPGNDNIGGGRVEFNITNLPAGSQIVTADDNLTEYRIIGSTAIGRWTWIACCTDGGALGLGAGDIDITIDPNFVRGISTWKLFVNDGDDTNDPSDDVWVVLDLTEDVTITRTSESADGDGDGYASDQVEGGTDCDDTNPNIHPGATEVLDGIDNNCAGGVDEGLYIDSVGPVADAGTAGISPVTVTHIATDDADREDANNNGVYDVGEDISPADGFFDTDTGIASVVLDGGSLNLTLDPVSLTPGDDSVSFTVRLTDDSINGTGSVIVTDVYGNTTPVVVTLIANRPPVVDAYVDAGNTVYYVDWQTADPGAGTASGVITLPNGDVVTVDLEAINPDGSAGTLLGAQTNGGTNFWAASAPYISAEVPNAPPDSDLLQLQGGTNTVYQVTLSEPIVDPIMAILSLGQGGKPTTYDFDSPFSIVSQGSGHFGGCSTCLTELPGDVLEGREGHGTIRFHGTFSTFSWTVPTPEYWHGFTFAIRTTSVLGNTDVDEGEFATNSGTVLDPDGDDVTLIANVGSVINNEDGTWSWSLATTDGPATIPVTITGDDGKGLSDTATFVVTVNNVAPEITDATSEPDSSIEVLFGDVGSGDTHTALIDWGDEGPMTEVDPATSPISAAHDYSEPGIYTVVVTVTDDDGDSDSVEIEVIGTGDCDCTKGQGWWKQQFDEKKLLQGKTDFSDAELAALLSVVNFASSQWNALDIVGARNVFDPPKSNNKGGDGNGSKSGRNDASATAPSGNKGKKKGQDENDESNDDSESLYDLSKYQEKALAQTLAAWLNFAKGAVAWDEAITVDGEEFTFETLIAEVEDLLSGEPTKADLERAKDLAEAVNQLDKDNPDCDTGSGGSATGSEPAPESGTGTGGGESKGKKK